MIPASAAMNAMKATLATNSTHTMYDKPTGKSLWGNIKKNYRHLRGRY